MKKGSQIEATNGEFQLPEPIVHRIQSFLTAKEAARTTILSKSWRSAWLTRPNLDFCITRGGEYEYLEFVEKTIQRYEQSNLKIESLKLCNESGGLYGCFVLDMIALKIGVLANDLITRALKIGATHLCVQDFVGKMVLSQGVFEAENLVELSLHGCKIEDLGFDRKVRCSKLESLYLRYVNINSEMISNIVSCCPLIRKLSLDCVVPFNGDDDDDHVYHSFSRLPFLKDLTLLGCRTQEVSSPSLERLYFATGYRYRSLNVKFDVPSIRKFRLEIDNEEIPSLSFVSASRDWESDVFIRTYRRGFSTLWFRGLNKLLTELSLSKMYLSLNMAAKKIDDEHWDYEVGAIRGLPKPKVESLTLDMFPIRALHSFVIFHGLFQICRPTFIIVNMLGNVDGIANNNMLRKTLARGLDDKFMYGLHDLEEVNVHLFDEDADEWRPLPLESLLDPSISPSGRQKTRFQLKWKL
ncbi:hypothetical protein CASFOL_006714 [Castilleja foliolosa]|uniref:F-box/LRR-repeat protein 15/At3g58940/PEG3-like LRR domain-containing protein n=1 Tax=Castilleja foliolosa TaxID=1961234 RepID=A0ABD3E846_9LAMI